MKRTIAISLCSPLFLVSLFCPAFAISRAVEKLPSKITGPLDRRTESRMATHSLRQLLGSDLSAPTTIDPSLGLDKKPLDLRMEGAANELSSAAEHDLEQIGVVNKAQLIATETAASQLQPKTTVYQKKRYYWTQIISNVSGRLLTWSNKNTGASSNAPSGQDLDQAFDGLSESKRVFLAIDLDPSSNNFGLQDHIESAFRHHFPKRSFRRIRAFSREEAMLKLETVLNDGEMIGHLHIITHGKSKSHGQEWTMSKLTRIGEFTERMGKNATVNEEFEEFFRPIKERLLDDAHIILTSCKVFRGKIDQVVNRTLAIGQYFQLSNWRIYGADKYDHPIAPLMSFYFILHPFRTMLVKIFLMMLLVCNLAVLPVVVLSSVFSLRTLVHIGIYNAEVLSIFLSIGYIMHAILSSSRTGLIMQFREGKLSTVRRVRRNKYISEMFLPHK